ncbi:GNAT family N-acetyltransferase [Metabacillus malikii]|uniref:Ribosomal protein S18 acetylase RimI-like enzyme n=1 Tax=Metabacillus malikii TaxID=1504265 RepID=A0ABT9ZN17_9BACI|nr:GNAT family N-acetyltransferase [Metabacillus malikii]MDQ0232625.1 ribosomal protein S18 acetylase RimI-like enzyme [Metabacillus malikii]
MTTKQLIQKIEELSMNALPALQTNVYDGWIVRFADGYTKRANSINPIYFSKEDLNSKIESAEQLYRKRNLKVVYKMTQQVFPENLDKTLEKHGYFIDGLTSVQMLPLRDSNIEIGHKAIVYDTLHDNWLMNFYRLNNICEKDQRTLKQMLLNIIPKSCYFLLNDENDETLACGMCVLESEYIGLFDIVTTEKYRNKGFGSKLVQHILQWGKDNGAKYAYLQVMLNNLPALKLYSKLGFEEIYRYWYRIKE